MNATLFPLGEPSPEQIAEMRLLVWAANVRNHKIPAPEEAAGWAGLLCTVLKIVQRADGPELGREQSKQMLLKRLKEDFGLEPPSDPKR